MANRLDRPPMPKSSFIGPTVSARLDGRSSRHALDRESQEDYKCAVKCNDVRV